jgi:hypothetical protein
MPTFTIRLDGELSVFQQARELASQGQWYEARQLIQEAGLVKLNTFHEVQVDIQYTYLESGKCVTHPSEPEVEIIGANLR